MAPQVLDLPDLLDEQEEAVEDGSPWQVVIYNDDVHTFEEVILQVQKATGVSLKAAFEITMTVHTKGQAVCFEGALSACERVAAVLREIALRVAVLPAD